MIRTRVVATVGPACSTVDTLAAMIQAGASVFRLNFSHGTHEAHGAALAAIRSAAERCRATVAIMGDLGGPKIRVGRMAGGSCTIQAGARLSIQAADIEGTCERLSCSYPALADEVRPGDRVLIDDGNVRLKVLEARGGQVLCECLAGGTISDRKGINLPDTEISAPSLTPKDRLDLAWACAQGLDYVALSFVRRPEDLHELRRELQAHGSSALTIAKIEKPQAVDHLNEIIDASDAILVARGDMGVEMDVARVPIIQKTIAVECRRRGKPAIVATQMLQSMVDSPVPTRAEVSDVANAILDDADAVMLSAETSVGKYPLEAVRTMARVAAETEGFRERFGLRVPADNLRSLEVGPAVIKAAGLAAQEMDAALVIVFTETGEAARLLSRYRLDMPILAVTAKPIVCRQMALLHGVIPSCRCEGPPDRSPAEFDRLAASAGSTEAGRRVLVISDLRPDVPGEMDTMHVHTIGHGR